MIQGLRFLALALALAGSCQACLAGKGPDKEYHLETYVKNYEKINKYLERKVATSDLRQNLAIAKEKVANERSKLSFRRHISLEKAFDRFIRLSREVIHGNPFLCLHLLGAIEENAEVLANEPSTRFRRIGKIIDNVERKFLEICPSVPLNESMVEFSFKTKSYDRIDFLLMDKVTTRDPEVNMAKVEELQAEKGEGTLGEALQLLVSLKTVLNEGACDADGFMVVLKNLVAARRSIRNQDMKIDDAMRRIDRLVLHYAHSYTNKCLDLFPVQLKPMIKQVDTMYNQRFEASKLIIGAITRADETPFKSQFTRPEVVAQVMSQPKEFSLYSRHIVVPCLNYLGDAGKFFKRFEYHHKSKSNTERFDQSARDQVGLSLGFASHNLCLVLIRPWQEQINRMSMDR